MAEKMCRFEQKCSDVWCVALYRAESISVISHWIKATGSKLKPAVWLKRLRHPITCLLWAEGCFFESQWAHSIPTHMSQTNLIVSKTASARQGNIADIWGARGWGGLIQNKALSMVCSRPIRFTLWLLHLLLLPVMMEHSHHVHCTHKTKTQLCWTHTVQSYSLTGVNITANHLFWSASR